MMEIDLNSNLINPKAHALNPLSFKVCSRDHLYENNLVLKKSDSLEFHIFSLFTYV